MGQVLRVTECFRSALPSPQRCSQPGASPFSTDCTAVPSCPMPGLRPSSGGTIAKGTGSGRLGSSVPSMAPGANTTADTTSRLQSAPKAPTQGGHMPNPPAHFGARRERGSERTGSPRVAQAGCRFRDMSQVTNAGGPPHTGTEGRLRHTGQPFESDPTLQTGRAFEGDDGHAPTC
jgi:hypothetical protein